MCASKIESHERLQLFYMFAQQIWHQLCLNKHFALSIMDVTYNLYHLAIFGNLLWPVQKPCICSESLI